MSGTILFSLFILALAVGLLPADPAGAETDAELLARATAIHERVITIDSHVDIPPDFGTEAYDPMQAKSPRHQLDLLGMQRGGLDAAFFIVYVPQRERTEANYARAMADAFIKFAAIRRMTDVQYPDTIGLALSAADVRRLHGEGRRAALIGIENGFAIGRSLELLNIYYDFGARYLGLLHNGHNDIGDSAVPSLGREEPDVEHGGLSSFGRTVIDRANALGIIVDVSHSAMSTTLDAIAASRAPVIASHSSVRALQDHPRNLPDRALTALKDKGGVVQIVAFDSYLRPVPEEKQAALLALREDMGLKDAADFARLSEAERDAYYARRAEIDRQWPRASVKALADHIDYAVKLIGIDHVGIASDFNGGGGVVGWNNAQETLNVTLELVRRGYTEDHIARLWGGNLLRVMEEVEAVAAASKNN